MIDRNEMWTLTVRPLAVGWGVQVPGIAGEMMYRTGAAAEAAARRLAACLARNGLAAKLVILLKDGSLGGRFLFPPVVADPALAA
jgi:hypothetical protein